ncbi:MAG TPA: TonB-dependent receptor [Candidatus Acidoferrales bacterium]|nr:TonB-dependent receptor [Candidatus Acidoferrales bacterium]
MITHKAGWLVSVLLILCVALPMSTKAQSTTAGAIVGTVRDPSGAVIPGASVTTTNVSTNARASATADANGRYVIDNLHPGGYAVEVNASGFGTYTQNNVTVEVGLSTTVDANLQVAGQSTTVVATAEAPVVTTDSPDFSTNVNSTTIGNLPINGRRWSAFKLLTPGAAPDGGFGLVSFRGISGLLNNSTVDGGDDNQAFFSEEKGRTRISYSISEASIQEYQVNTSDYSAEYGRSAGGVINAITKSGTNEFHGEAFWYFRDSDFSAINPFAVQTVLVNGVNTTVHINPEDKQHQFGGTLGGAIIKNKLFYFFSADQQLRKFPAVGVPGNPSAFFAPFTSAETATLASRGISTTQANAGLAFLQSVTGTVPRTGDELVLLPKIDWQVNSNNHVSVEYNRMRWSSPGGIQTGAVVARGIDSFGDDFVKDDTVIARLSSTLNSLTTNQFLFEYGRDFEFESNSTVLPGEPVATTGFSPQIAISGGGGITFGMPNFLQRPAFPDEHRYQWTDTVALSHGTHLFKFGADINRVNDLDENLFEGFGAYSYSNRVDFISDYAAFTNSFSAPPCGTSSAPTGCYNNFFQGFGPQGFAFTTVDTGLFANDEWRIRPSVTLNLGLRYDRESLPSAQIPNTLLLQSGKLPNDNDAFGPRVGVAWDLTGKGTTVLRGGYGIYYGRIINANIFNAIADTGNPAGQLTFQFRPTTAGAPLYPNIAAAAPTGTLNTPNVVVVGNNLEVPMVHEFDAVFEHQLARNTAISVSYIGSVGRNLPTYIDQNLPQPTSTITYTVSGGTFDSQQFTTPLFTGTRPNANFGAISNIESIVNSHYNALAIQFNRRLTNGLQVQAFYTYSHAQDTGQSSNTGTPQLNVFNPFDLGLENATSTFNMPQRFVVLAVWQPSYFKGGRMGELLLNGFSISPIITAQSGAPITGTVSGSAPSGTGALSSGINGSGTSTNRPPWIARNSFQMPRVVDVDLEVAKSFPITERWNFKMFVQAFNLMNHVNATGVDSLLYVAGGTAAKPTLTFNPDFLHVTASSNSLINQRQIQIGARLNF